jgi:hypothetical protein
MFIFESDLDLPRPAKARVQKEGINVRCDGHGGLVLMLFALLSDGSIQGRYLVSRQSVVGHTHLGECRRRTANIVI